MTALQGDLVTHHQAGGGGHGDPLARDLAAVWHDAWNGKISPAYARHHHGVVLGVDGPDREATVQLRASMRSRA